MKNTNEPVEELISSVCCVEVLAYYADLSRKSPYPFLSLGIGHGTPVKHIGAEGKVIGFKGQYTAIVEFAVGTMRFPMEAFL